MAGLSFGIPLSQSSVLSLFAQSVPQPTTAQPHDRPAAPPTPTALSPQDEQFLDDIEHSCFLFFWEQTNPPTGLTKDRCNVRVKDTSTAASIASTGFGLTVICIGAMRGFVSYAEARLRVIQCLSFRLCAGKYKPA
jgi:hypothetical protein